MRNPYAELIRIMQKEGAKFNPATIQLGTVLSVTPLTIQVGDIQIDKDNILIAEDLIDHTREISMATVAATGTAGDHSISSIGIPDAIVAYKTCLKQNDLVILLQIDDYRFVIFCKVVSISE